MKQVGFAALALVVLVVAGVLLSAQLVLTQDEATPIAADEGSQALTPIASSDSTPTPTASPASTNTPAGTPAPTASPTSTSPDLLVYPYLGETTPTSVVISWVTSENGASEVRYGVDQFYRSVAPASSSSHDGKYWHSATLAGLTADTTYRYRVYTSGNDVTPWSEITFTTAPESSEPSFTFVALGDSRPAHDTEAPPSQGALDVAAEMDRHSFDLALCMGDTVWEGGGCSGSGSSWNQYIRAYFDVYRESIGHIPFYLSIGNHELKGGDCGYQGYTDVYYLPENAPSGAAEEYYSFDWGNAHFVSLDTIQSYTVGSTQYNWLVSDLQDNTRFWTFIFFHVPPYSSGLHGGSSTVQEDLVPVFETYGVDVVFAGHDHDYERTCPIRDGACTTSQDGGVVYYVTGGGGAPLRRVVGDWFTAYSDRAYHFVRAELNDCSLRLDAIDASGDVFDSYEIDRCDSPTSESGHLIEVGDDWRYWKGYSEASEPVTAWRQVEYDDSGWLVGPTGIGYGDGDDATVLTDMQNNYISVFMRRTFTVSDPAEAASLELEIDYDDGFIAYLNGVKIAQGGFDAFGDSVPYDQESETAHEAGTPEVFSVPASVLVAGENVLAIQGHNRSLDSSDLSIIPALWWEYEP